MQSLWRLFKKLTHPLPRIVKTLKILKTVLAINKLHRRNYSRESFPGGRKYNLCTDVAMMARHIYAYEDSPRST
jgi:sulfate adenylyltransferase subunit 1 (EFTu-like GTPase family)